MSWALQSRKRPAHVSPAGRQMGERRRRSLRPVSETMEPRVAPVTGLTSFAPGAYVIDMGQATQTVANSLRPYGMVYDLVDNQHIPVDRAINPSKAVFGADFTAGGKSCSGGSFVIEAPFSAPQSTIAKWT